MFRVSVMYPNQEGAKFDFDYYEKKHMALVKKHMMPFGLVKTEIDKGISGGGDQPAPYLCIGYLYFKSKDDYDKAIAEVGPLLRGDIAHYTNIAPIRQVSEILE